MEKGFKQLASQEPLKQARPKWMLGMLLDSGNSHTLVEGNGYNTVLVTLIYSRVRNISSRCYGRDYEWRKLFGTTKSLREAETLVAQLTINDLITFCSSFGLESHRTQLQLEEHLLYYYATQIGRDKPPFLTPRVRKRKTFDSTIPSESNKIGSDSESLVWNIRMNEFHRWRTH